MISINIDGHGKWKTCVLFKLLYFRLISKLIMFRHGGTILGQGGQNLESDVVLSGGSGGTEYPPLNGGRLSLLLHVAVSYTLGTTFFCCLCQSILSHTIYMGCPFSFSNTDPVHYIRYDAHLPYMFPYCRLSLSVFPYIWS